jgi:hypothetical protein
MTYPSTLLLPPPAPPSTPSTPHPQEAPSDFQDYTLVAIVAVAAHLLKQPLGEEYGLRRLSEVHGHDFGSLDQVFWHILTRLSYYRELHVRAQSAAEEAAAVSALKPGAEGRMGVDSHQ